MLFIYSAEHEINTKKNRNAKLFKTTRRIYLNFREIAEREDRKHTDSERERDRDYASIIRQIKKYVNR